MHAHPHAHIRTFACARKIRKIPYSCSIFVHANKRKRERGRERGGVGDWGGRGRGWE